MAQDQPNLLAKNGTGECGADKDTVLNREPVTYKCKYALFNDCPNWVLIPMTPCTECKEKGYLT